MRFPSLGDNFYIHILVYNDNTFPNNPSYTYEIVQKTADGVIAIPQGQMTLEALRNQLPEADRNNIDLENNKYIIYSANIINNANGDKTGTLINIDKLGIVDKIDDDALGDKYSSCDIHCANRFGNNSCYAICFVKTIEYVLDKSYIISADNAELDPIYNYGPMPNKNGEIDLSHYASKYIEDYEIITELPEENKKYLDEVLTTGKYKVTNMSYMFAFCPSLTSLDVSNWDTSNVTDMYSMFSGCVKLTSFDVSNWDTSNVTNMDHMFYNCNSLTSLDVSNWDTSNVTNMSNMFSDCFSLTSLDVSNWDTSNVTYMYYMFYRCTSLISLDVSNWDTSNVTNMDHMFYNCNSLTSLDVSNWDTSNVTNMSNMFSDCFSLTSLDVSNWDTSKVTYMNSMFYNCSELQTITGTIDLTSCTNYYYMLLNTSVLTSINIKLPSTITQSTFLSKSEVTNTSAVHFVS